MVRRLRLPSRARAASGCSSASAWPRWSRSWPPRSRWSVSLRERRRHHDGRQAAGGAAGRGRRRGRADARRREGDRLRGVQPRRPDAAAGPGRRGQEVRRRRLPARHPGLQGARSDRGVELLRQRQGIPRHRRVRADGRQRGRHRRLHADQRLRRVDEGRPPALARLPLRGGQPRHALRRPRAREVDALPLHRRAPGRVHVPLRHQAGSDAHRRRHARDVRRQAEGAGPGRPRAVDDAAGVLHRQAGRRCRHGQDAGQDSPT